jgi:uncharacterized membrane protein
MSALHFDAVITPNRSLSKRGLTILLSVMIALNLLVGGFFLAIGALPVPLFLGVDVLGVLIAFRVSNRRSAGQRERVQVSAEEVRVQHELGEAVKVVWRSPTAFTRVEVEGQERSDTRVRLRLSGRSRVIGRALSPGERIELAGALEGAIRSARAERYPAP